jgi:hypothetical protein
MLSRGALLTTTFSGVSAVEPAIQDATARDYRRRSRIPRVMAFGAGGLWREGAHQGNLCASHVACNPQRLLFGRATRRRRLAGADFPSLELAVVSALTEFAAAPQSCILAPACAI